MGEEGVKRERGQYASLGKASVVSETEEVILTGRLWSVCKNVHGPVAERSIPFPFSPISAYLCMP